jgi:hypothetical protein
MVESALETNTNTMTRMRDIDPAIHPRAVCGRSDHDGARDRTDKDRCRSQVHRKRRLRATSPS